MADKVDQAKFWNDRYAGEDYLFGTEPNAFLAANIGLLPESAKVLAVADGEGRNSVFLAKHGHDVTAIDVSERALEKAERLAERSGVHVKFLQADLIDFDWPVDQYDVIVAIFIQFAGPGGRAKMFEGFRRAVRPGGLLLMQGYRPEQLELGTGGPPHAENMYTENMLRAAFAGWRINHLQSADLTLREGVAHSGPSAVISLVARA